jgi:glycosyltransferase involved in cell wall biosynthesis
MNLICPINQLGYGVVGLNVLLEIEKAGKNPSLFPLGNIEAHPDHHEVMRKAIDRARFFDPQQPSLRIWHQNDLAMHVGQGMHAFPIFELDRFKPDELHHLSKQDCLFVPSEWAKNVCKEHGLRYTHVAPLGVDSTLFAPSPLRASPTTTFLNCGKWELRKGHHVLLEAFNKAFQPDDNVLLVMNCFNPCLPEPECTRYNQSWVMAYMQSKLGQAGKIQIIPQRLPSQLDVANLMAQTDCGVFPSLAEGWGLETSEMLAMGRHIITTRYSAHTEYCTDDNSLLIDIEELEPAWDGYWFRADDPIWSGKPGRWARFGEKQEEQLIEHLRSIHRRKQEGSLKVNQAGVDSMKKFTWENTVKKICEVLCP